ncbi:MAG TPA: permease prefix domain 1-containing protein [Terriglobia bacterium]|nr:permease prefix domain 1-containing protein [Terriglobia bacterium]
MWWRRKERDIDLRRELESHIEAEAAEQQENGVDADESRYAARRAFGNVGLVSEDVREAWGGMWLDRLAQDVRFGLRTLRKDVSFALLAVAALALGIGAATVIFSVVDNVVLEPFPYADAQRLTKFYIHDLERADQVVGHEDAGAITSTTGQSVTRAESSVCDVNQLASRGADISDSHPFQNRERVGHPSSLFSSEKFNA